MINTRDKGTTEKEWFAIRTKPHMEMVALSNYQHQGIDGFLPTVLKTVRHARQTKKVIRPFFSGYLFVSLSQEERNWTAISNTIGVLSPVKFGECYPVVPDSIIEELRKRINEKGYIPLEDEFSKLQKGQMVNVISGQLEGLQGMFLDLKCSDRAVVLLDLLRRAVLTTVPLESIQVA